MAKRRQTAYFSAKRIMQDKYDLSICTLTDMEKETKKSVSFYDTDDADTDDTSYRVA